MLACENEHAIKTGERSFLKLQPSVLLYFFFLLRTLCLRQNVHLDTSTAKSCVKTSSTRGISWEGYFSVIKRLFPKAAVLIPSKHTASIHCCQRRPLENKINTQVEL